MGRLSRFIHTIDDLVYVSTIDNNVWSPDDYAQGLEIVWE